MDSASALGLGDDLGGLGPGFGQVPVGLRGDVVEIEGRHLRAMMRVGGSDNRGHGCLRRAVLRQPGWSCPAVARDVAPRRRSAAAPLPRRSAGSARVIELVTRLLRLFRGHPAEESLDDRRRRPNSAASIISGSAARRTASSVASLIAQVDGVGQVMVGGSSLPAVRVELNPTALNRYGIPTSAVRAAIATTNANRPKGILDGDTRHWQIAANDQANKAVNYRPIIVAYRNGAAVRLTDVGNRDRFGAGSAQRGDGRRAARGAAHHPAPAGRQCDRDG